MLGTTRPLAVAPQVCEDPGDDVGDEDGAQGKQDMLDAAEAPLEHEHADGHGREWHADVPTRAGQYLHTGGDTRELRADRPDVRDDERGERHLGPAAPVPLADEPHEALAGDDARADRQVVKHDQRGRRQRQHPQQPVTVIGAEYRIGRDARGVIIGQPCQQARPEHRKKSQHPGATTPQHLERPLRTAHDEVGPGLPVAARGGSLPPCGHRPRLYSQHLAGSRSSPQRLSAAAL
jgi:hypothetical protein